MGIKKLEISIGIFGALILILGIGLFSSISQIDAHLNSVSDTSVPIVEETNQLTNLLWKNNKILEDYLNEHGLEELSVLKLEFEQGNDDFLQTLSSLRNKVMDKDFVDNLDNIKEQHFNFMKHSETLMLIRAGAIKGKINSDTSVTKSDELAILIEFDVKRAIIELDEINDRAYGLSVGLDEQIEKFIFRIRLFIAMIISLCIAFTSGTIIIQKKYYDNLLRQVLMTWEKILRLKNKIKVEEFNTTDNLAKLNTAIDDMGATISELNVKQLIDGKSPIQEDDQVARLDYDHKQIFEYIKNQTAIGKSISFKDIKDNFNITFPTVQKRIKYLVDNNIVRIEKSGRNKLIFLQK